jgi:hypothetical protein
MISLTWMFIGAIIGLLVVSVFTPPNRKVPSLPTPNSDDVFYTESGCVKFKTQEVECGSSATSLNFVASQHK